MFHGNIYVVIGVRTIIFNDDRGNIAVINKFNLHSMSNMVFIRGGCLGVRNSSVESICYFL